MALLITNLTLTGCDSANTDANQDAKVHISGDKVTVDKSLIHASIPERYQPSYNLEGTLIPINQEALTLPPSLQSHMISSEILIKQGDVVEQGQIVAEYVVNMDDSKARALANKFTDVYIDGEKIKQPSEVTQVTSAALSTIGIDTSSDTASSTPNQTAKDTARNNNTSTTKTSHNPSLDASHAAPTDNSATPSNNTAKTTTKTSDQATSPKADNSNLIAVTLVYKSPIAGQVTKIETHPQDNDSTSLSSDATNTDSTSQTDSAAQKAAKNNQADGANKTHQHTPVITIADTQHLQLIGRLPLSTQSQLTVGRSVNFTVYELHSEFTGQISHIIPDPKTQTLIVKAPLVAGKNNANALKPGMNAAMSIEYGQIQLGIRLPREAIHEANLDLFSEKHPRPTSPVNGNVWIVGQDKRLAYDRVEVVQYFADSDKFLVSGIDNDSLVCLADLPKDSVGKSLTVN